MRTRMLIPLLAAAGLVLAGCGEENSATPGTPAGEQSEDPAEDGKSNGDTAADADAFDARAELIVDAWPETPEPMEKFTRDVWPVEGVAGTDPADTTLTVTVGHGGCDADWGAWLHETDELVIVSGWAVEDPEVEACHDMMMYDEVEVELAAELGDRVVVDAVTVRDPRGEDYDTAP